MSKVSVERQGTVVRTYERIYGLPPGKYYVGDPCYAVPNDDWDEVLGNTGYIGLFKWMSGGGTGREDYLPFDQQAQMFRVTEGEREWYIAASRTAYGDGLYQGDDGNSYPVDAGMIGVVSVNYADLEGNGNMPDCGHITEFKRGFTISYEEDEGTIVIGHIIIKTDPNEDEDECWYCGDPWCNEECQEEDDDDD
jgi:hypothetical protein